MPLSFPYTGQVGTLLFPDGTAAAPSIAFINQPGMGFTRNGAGILRFYANNALTLQFYNTGALVGIDIVSDIGQLRFGLAGEIALKRDGVNILAIKDFAALAASTLRIYAAGANFLQFDTSGILMLTSGYAFTNNAAAAVGTLTNSPTAGNPTKWIPINDNGTVRNIPAW